MCGHKVQLSPASDQYFYPFTGISIIGFAEGKKSLFFRVLENILEDLHIFYLFVFRKIVHHVKLLHHSLSGETK